MLLAVRVSELVAVPRLTLGNWIFVWFVHKQTQERDICDVWFPIFHWINL